MTKTIPGFVIKCHNHVNGCPNDARHNSKYCSSACCKLFHNRNPDKKCKECHKKPKKRYGFYCSEECINIAKLRLGRERSARFRSKHSVKTYLR